MHFDQIASLWTKYRATAVNKQVHPNDHMMNTAVNGWTDYNFVGISTIQVLMSHLANADTQQVTRILDFGCGHGRAARHIRACFPHAAMTFCDIDPEAAGFCAESFGGDALVSTDDFGSLDLDGRYDLIWLGSVFTHLDYGRMVMLFDKLQDHLAVGGVLVATFRGRHMYDMHEREADPAQYAKWRNLCAQYEAGGVGFGPYRAGDNWGLSLTRPEAIIGLGARHRPLRLIGYAERGWATAHDVAAWTRDETKA